MRPGIFCLIFLALTTLMAGCLVTPSETCSVATELATCHPPRDCCEGRCIHGCDDPGIDRSFTYILRGTAGTIDLRVFTKMNDYAECVGSTIQDEFHLTCEHKFFMTVNRTEIFLDEKNTTLLKLDDPIQKLFLEDLLTAIRSASTDPDDQARVAVSLVQHIPYDLEKQQEFLRGEYSSNRLPYEVLYENSGICNEKAKLLAFFLRDLGYGVALLSYPSEKHMAVGIRVPEGYASPGCGEYAYVESTRPAIISQKNLDLISEPEIIVLSEGRSLDSIGEDYADSGKLERLIAGKNGLTRTEYDELKSLSQKYDLEIIFR